MAKADLQAPAFTDDDAAREAMEAVLWPFGPRCPRCQSLERIGQMTGTSGRPGLYYCGECKRQFTVTVGTIFERSKVPLSKWWLAVHLMASSKKGMSAHQMHRMLGVTYQTAWFMEHRIRAAMASGDLTQMGGEGVTVEIDETFIGRKPGMPKRRGYAHKHAVMTSGERGPQGGKARSFHVEGTAAADLLPIIKAHVNSGTHVMTDEAGQYAHLNKHFATHDFVTHSIGEYGRGNIHTNTVDGFYSVFKRGMKGIYQHCSETHLHRYVAEFDFRYNNRSRLGVDDAERAARVIRGTAGKRLMYRRPDSASAA
ncbi:MAG: IS1595 family transposase [Acidiferrobacteraceae bacterium]